MAANVLVDAGFLIALLSRRDEHHRWAVDHASRFPPAWITCEAALSEAFHLLEPLTILPLTALLHRRALRVGFRLAEDQETVVALLEKYADVPMSLADACLVRMSETYADPALLTTNSDFRRYRRHGRQVVPCMMPR
jgi:predicted nucleic acid-binding protein